MATETQVRASEEQIEALVDNLESFPLIWNTNCESYSDRSGTRASWASLCKIVGLPLKDLKRTYETLRKRFRDEHKVRRSQLPESASDGRRPYKYYDRLQFLIPALKCKYDEIQVSDVVSLSTAEAADENNDLQPEVRLIAVVNGSDLTMPPTPTVNSPSPPVKPKNLKRKANRDIVETVRKQPTGNILSEPGDDVHFWALSLAADMRMIGDILTRKRLMHKISGIVLEEIEHCYGD